MVARCDRRPAWRTARSRCCIVLTVALTAVVTLTACGSGGWPPDPVSKPSEVTGRIWYCTPAYTNGQPGDDKASESAVKMEIVTPGYTNQPDSGRFPPDTVLGQVTAQPGEVWKTGSVHEFFIVWLQPHIASSDLVSSSLRVRITRNFTGGSLFEASDRWVFWFFISFDVIKANESGEPEIDWHLAVKSTGEFVAEQDMQTVVDTPISDLHGWPSPCLNS